VPTKAEFNAHVGWARWSESEMRPYREARGPVDLSGRPFAGLWLRFINPEDLEVWGRFLAAWLPRTLERESESDWARFGH
jgi:hypothetical protein